MNKVQDKARLHPTTVTDHEQHAKQQRRARGTGKRRSTPRNGQVSTQTVDPRVQAEVDRIIAGGSYTKTRVVADPKALDGLAVIVR